MAPGTRARVVSARHLDIIGLACVVVDPPGYCADLLQGKTCWRMTHNGVAHGPTYFGSADQLTPETS